MSNGIQAIGRDRVRGDARRAARRIFWFVVAAVFAGLLLEWLGPWATPIGVVFLALAGVYLVRAAYALLMGLIALLSKPFDGEGPAVRWSLAWIALSVVEGAVLIGLGLSVIEAAGWWTEMQLPPVIEETGQMQP